MTRRPSIALPIIAALIALASSVVPAQAQTTEVHLFTCKVVCGHQLGNVRFLNDSTPVSQPYENLKPGNYATTCNLYNYDLSGAEQTILPYVAIEGLPLLFLGAFSVPVLNAGASGCLDIVNSFPPPPPSGLAFEGYLVFFTFSPSVRVDGVYTYSSQNGFERHLVWDTLSGFLEVGFQALGLDLTQITSAVDLSNILVETNAAAASGAGGLGLGASIDIEHYEGITLPLTPEGESNLPPEVLSTADSLGIVLSSAVKWMAPSDP